MTDLQNAPHTLPARVELTTTSWLPTEQLDYDQWEQIGTQLLRMGRAWQWWVGDWILYGEGRYPEIYDQAIELTGLEYHTISNVINVCRAIDPARRRDNLSFSHHAEVAALPPVDQAEWLDRATDEGMTVARLRTALRAAKRAGTPPLLPEDNVAFRGTLQVTFGAYDQQAAQEKINDLADALEKRGVSVISRAAHSTNQPEDLAA